MTERSLPPLNWLRAFEASARHLSFTGAAQELNMTQSAVSQQIKSLEAYLGRPLFIRRTRRLEISETGQAFLPVVREAFNSLRMGTRNIIGFDRDQALEVRSNLGFSVFWLAPRLPRLFARHPWIKLNVTTSPWVPDRADTTADIEFRFGLSAVTGLRAERILQDHYYPVCRPGAKPASVEEMVSRPLFDCTGIKANWDSWMRATGRSLPGDARISWATTYAMAFAMAEAGAGCTLSHRMLDHDLIASGRLVRPFAEAVPMEEAYYLLLPDEGAVTPAAKAFLDWFEEERAKFLATDAIGREGPVN